MKKTLLLLAAALLTLTAAAQARYGTLRYDSILHEMPEYIQAEQEIKALRGKYQEETAYNERAFKRQFAEFLQGQKDFTQSILLKRQRDLQESFEKGMAYRQAADSLLRQAETDLYQPARKRLDSAITEVAESRGYELIINLDECAFPFVNPAVSEDITPHIMEILNAAATTQRPQ